MEPTTKILVINQVYSAKVMQKKLYLTRKMRVIQMSKIQFFSIFTFNCHDYITFTFPFLVENTNECAKIYCRLF